MKPCNTVESSIRNRLSLLELVHIQTKWQVCDPLDYQKLKLITKIKKLLAIQKSNKFGQNSSIIKICTRKQQDN